MDNKQSTYSANPEPGVYNNSSIITHYVKDIMARIDVFPIKDTRYLLHQINSKKLIISLMYCDENGSHEIVINEFEAAIYSERLYTRGRISIYSQGDIHSIQLVINHPPTHLNISLTDINICPIH
jgi:hypothetical protein